MIIVADSSPFIVLLNIGHVTVLPDLYEAVIIPPEVEAELGSPGRPEPVRAFVRLHATGLAHRPDACLRRGDC